MPLPLLHHNTMYSQYSLYHRIFKIRLLCIKCAVHPLHLQPHTCNILVGHIDILVNATAITTCSSGQCNLVLCYALSLTYTCRGGGVLASLLASNPSITSSFNTHGFGHSSNSSAHIVITSLHAQSFSMYFTFAFDIPSSYPISHCPIQSPQDITPSSPATSLFLSVTVLPLLPFSPAFLLTLS